MYRIAMNAGHYLGTPGKRITKALDPNETREWTLNNRVCDKVEQRLTGYTGYELLRIDDTTGKTDVPLRDRTDAANAWGADDYYAVHHNALNGTPWKGGGIVVYVHPNACKESREMQKQLYDALIKHTGLKGNRSEPLAKANFHEVRETKMPAVLMELGFMDSSVDAPIILTEKFADQCADAIVEVMVARGKLQKKTDAHKEIKATEPAYRKDDALKGTYKVTPDIGLNIRNGAGTKPNKYGQDKSVLVAIPKGTKVSCWGYYTDVSGVKWLSVQFTYSGITYTGFACEKHLKKV